MSSMDKFDNFYSKNIIQVNSDVLKKEKNLSERLAIKVGKYPR